MKYIAVKGYICVIKQTNIMEEKEYINVYGARVHNLKNIDVEIPRDS